MSGRHVLVFVQDGCPACDEFTPRIARISQPYRARGLPIHLVNMRGVQGVALAEKLRIEASPTTVALNGDRRLKTAVGAVDDREIAALLAAAVR